MLRHSAQFGQDQIASEGCRQSCLALCLRVVLCWLIALLPLTSCGELLSDASNEKKPQQENISKRKALSSSQIKMRWPTRGFSLNSLQPDFGVSIDGCSSGFTATQIHSGSSSNQNLYRGDRNCLASVYQINFDGGQYLVQSGYSFGTAVGQTTPFKETSSDSYLYVRTLSQLNSTIGASEVAEFSVSLSKAGTTVQLDGFVVVSATPDVATIAEDGGSITYTITANEAPPSAVTIHYTMGGTATPTDDYVAPSGTVVLPSQQLSVQFTVDVTDDALSESDELLSLTIDTGHPGYFPLNTSANVIITDNDIYLPAAGQVLHLEPSGLVNSGGSVPTWTDSSGAGHDATQGTGSLQPDYVASGINSFASAAFNASEYLVLANHADFNTASTAYTEKTLSVVFQTSNDVTTRQVIYEQGGASRGLNFYIEGGLLYAGGWNLNNDDGGATTPWGPLFVSAAIGPSTDYVARLTYDQPAGKIQVFLNAAFVGEVTGVGKLFAHSGAIGIGSMNQDSYFHNGSSTGTGHPFDGVVAEMALYNDSLDNGDGVALDNYLVDTYGIEVPTLVSLSASATDIPENGGSSTITVTRSKFSANDLTVNLFIGGTATPDTDYTALSTTVVIPAYSLSTSFPLSALDDSIEDIGETVTMSILSGIGYELGSVPNMTFTLVDDDSYVSPAGHFAWWRADQNVTESSGAVSAWGNMISGFHTVTQSTGTKQPQITSGTVGGQDAVLFDGGDEFAVANSNDINTGGPYTERAFAIVIKTGADVASRQLIWEQGGSIRGINISIENNELCFAAYNTPNDGPNTPWNPVGVCGSVLPNTVYFAFYELDGVGLTLSGRQNGVDLGTAPAGPIYNHSGAIGFGAIIATTVYKDGTQVASGEGYSGHVAEFMLFSQLLNATEEADLESYVSARYGLTFP